ncbi:MAG: heparinase II/III family protein [Armatimonadota bacterium]|nr:MAG: heparinase II/III family protein [Armatimonadota bacterium]
MDFDFRSMLGLAALSWWLLAAMLTLAAAPSRSSAERPSRAEGDPTDHPRLYFGPQDLRRLTKVAYAAPRYLEEKSFTVTYFGGTDISFPLPPQQPGPLEDPPGFDVRFGHYPYWTGMSRQVQARLESLALSYAATGDARYARRAVEYMLALAGWRTWSDPDCSNRTCLDTCHLMMGAAFAYDACWDAMSPQERGQIREAMVRLGLAPLAEDALERAEHNLQMLRNAALGVGALAILPDHPQADHYLEAATRFFRWWLDRRETSPNTEGLAYTSYGLDNCLLFGAALAQAESDREIIHHPYVARAVRWALYFWGPDASGVVNFCDASIGHPFEVTMRVASKYLRDPYAGYYLQRTGRLERQDFIATILHDPKPAVAWPPPWPPSALFRSIGWAVLRSGWGDADTLFSLISSSSKEGHCHLDANHFVLNCGGEWLAADSGYKSYRTGALTNFTQGTAGHNSILIGGVGQRDKAGAITDFFTSPIFDYIVGDASRCYDPQLLWRFLRRVIYVRPHFFVMLDELESPESKRFEFLLHTDRGGQYEIDGKPAKAGEATAGRVSLVKPTARLDVRFLEPSEPHVTLDHHPGTQDEYPPHFTARDARARESQRFLTALVASRKPPSGLVLALEDYAPGRDESDAAGQPAARDSIVRLDTYGALLFRAREAGDALTLHLPVPANATYRIVGHFLKSPAYGDWQMCIDGAEVGAAYCGYAPDVLTHQEWDLGTLRLAKGSHEFAFRVTGKHELSSGYLVGVDDIELRPVEDAEPTQASGATRFRRLSGEGWMGAACVVADARYRAYYRLTGADEIADKDMYADADAALVVSRPDGQSEVAFHRATRVEIGGREILQASTPVSFSLVPGKQWNLTLAADSDGDVVVYLDGQPRRPSIPPSLARRVRYDPTAEALRIRVRPGSHTITWSMT